MVEGLALLVLRGFTRKVDRRIASFNSFVQTGTTIITIYDYI